MPENTNMPPSQTLHPYTEGLPATDVQATITDYTTPDPDGTPCPFCHQGMEKPGRHLLEHHPQRINHYLDTHTTSSEGHVLRDVHDHDTTPLNSPPEPPRSPTNTTHDESIGTHWNPTPTTTGESSSLPTCARCGTPVSRTFYRVWAQQGELDGCRECLPRSIRFGEDIYDRDPDDIQQQYNPDQYNPPSGERGRDTPTSVD